MMVKINDNNSFLHHIVSLDFIGRVGNTKIDNTKKNNADREKQRKAAARDCIIDITTMNGMYQKRANYLYLEICLVDFFILLICDGCPRAFEHVATIADPLSTREIIRIQFFNVHKRQCRHRRRYYGLVRDNSLKSLNFPFDCCILQCQATADSLHNFVIVSFMLLWMSFSPRFVINLQEVETQVSKWMEILNGIIITTTVQRRNRILYSFSQFRIEQIRFVRFHSRFFIKNCVSHENSTVLALTINGSRLQYPLKCD